MMDISLRLDQNNTGQKAYFSWNGTLGIPPQLYSTLRLPDLGLDFGIGSDEIKIENSSLLLTALQEQPERVQALFVEEKQEDIFDENMQTNRDFEGISTPFKIS